MKTFLIKIFAVYIYMIIVVSSSILLIADDLTLDVISGARLKIEFKGKTTYCTTNETGVFAIYLSDTSKTFIEAKEYKAIINVELPKEPAKLGIPNSKINAINKTLNYILKQSDAPYYEFTLFFDKSRNQLIIKQNTNIQKSSIEQKVPRGQAGKHGDKYVGQVAHF
jgi:hypothetical protein